MRSADVQYKGGEGRLLLLNPEVMKTGDEMGTVIQSLMLAEPTFIFHLLFSDKSKDIGKNIVVQPHPAKLRHF